MLNVEYTTKFKRDLKLMKRRRKDLAVLHNEASGKLNKNINHEEQLLELYIKMSSLIANIKNNITDDVSEFLYGATTHDAYFTAKEKIFEKITSLNDDQEKIN